MTDPNWLEECLAGMARAQVAVFGDFCLDAYWRIDPDEGELSVETGEPVRRVREQRYSLGGAGNIVANLAALGVKAIRAVGLVGDDLFGHQMSRMLKALDVDCTGLLATQTDWQTLVYAKPCIDDVEQNRIDFGAFGTPFPETMDALAAALDAAAAGSDVVILNQQIPAGVSPPDMIRRINAVVASHPACLFIVDSRHRAELYEGCLLKLNVHEASRLVGKPASLDERIPTARAQAYALELFGRTGRPVFVTRGENGLIDVDDQGVHVVPGIQVVERVDPVGAGDTLIAAAAAVLGSGGDLATAAHFANLAASITARKLQTTGTASPEELRALGPMPDYVYLPELADDPRQARYHAGTEIEIVRELPDVPTIRHAVFDHDGTLSTLRQGWEHIMAPMMVRAILGPEYETADEALYHKVVDAVRTYIDKTTGVQTLVQMQGLVDLVRRFRCVPEGQVLDMHGYKALYNEALLRMIRGRVEKLSRGELDSLDFEIKNARALLERLHGRGVKLYLVSGTDQADVKAEAESLGYAHLFEGRIFGAVGDVKVDAKRVVLERILDEHRLGGPDWVTFGDGPVEIRETRKREGLAVGVASDEVRRFGLNAAKRSRLIRAGADLIVPDYSQLDALLGVLGMA